MQSFGKLALVALALILTAEAHASATSVTGTPYRKYKDVECDGICTLKFKFPKSKTLILQYMSCVLDGYSSSAVLNVQNGKKLVSREPFMTNLLAPEGYAIASNLFVPIKGGRRLDINVYDSSTARCSINGVLVGK